MINSFLRRYWLKLLISVVLSAAGAAFTLIILSHVNSLANVKSPGNELRPFVIGLGWVIALWLTDSLAQFMLARLGGELMARLRIELSRRFIALDYERLMNRKHMVLDALVGDMWRIVPLVLEGPQVIYNVVVALLCSVYLSMISFPLFAVLFAFLSIVTLVSIKVERSAGLQFDEMRRAEAVLAERYRSISEGKKEMSLNPHRATHFIHNSLIPSVVHAQSLMQKLHLRWGWNQSWSTGGLYAAILSLVYFGDAVLDLPAHTLFKFVVGTLFLTGPVNIILKSGQMVGTGLASLRHLERIGLDVSSEIDQSVTDPKEEATGTQEPWKQLVAKNICYRYPDETEAGRTIGPISLSIRRGEMIFIVGGNGSGKSTLLLMLCGLLAPNSGGILIDGCLENASSYRTRFAGVFGDCHLFLDVLGPAGECLSDEEIQALLRQMYLDSRVQVQGGTLSTVTLSTGQRKRLALLQCYAEDREIYFFDEWAADQDPQFREHFYQVLLPDLRRRGKTVLVISHDDRYFHVADRIVKLEAGLIVSDVSIQSEIQPERASAAI